MMQLFPNRFVSTCVLMMALSNANVLSAQTVTGNDIYTSRILYTQSQERDALFKLIPMWDPKVIENLFAVYQKKSSTLTKNKANSAEEIAIYNARFINAHWGPLQNPFNKYPRPAKLFVFPSDKSEPFYTAPIVQDAISLQYYVFDTQHAKPVLLHDWLASIPRKGNSNVPLTINICEKYAIFPGDSCAGKTYSDEVKVTSRVSITEEAAGLTKELPVPSAHRDPALHWKTVERQTAYHAINDEDNIMSSAVYWNDVPARDTVFKKITQWPNYSAIQANFAQIRDPRFFLEETNRGFLRRISWLYPDDGCWTRAAAAIKAFFGTYYKEPNPVNDFRRPARLFAFGNLCVNSDNAANGKVTWWYHVAPIVKDAETGNAYVLDPAVEPKKPLLVADWIARVSANEGACGTKGGNNYVEKVAICNGYGSGPGDQCEGSTFAREANESLGQHHYLRAEYTRQKLLNRDPDKALGDTPPWLGSVSKVTIEVDN